MAVEEVGLENLPNVYISEIILSNKFLSKTSDSDATSISVSFVVSDYEQTNGMLAWFDYELFSKYMRVIVVQSTSIAFSDNITNGDAELLPFSFQKLASYTPEQVEFQTLKLKTNQSAPEEFDLVDGDTKLFNFDNKFFFSTPAETQELTYFAAVYIDLQDISNDLNLDFNNTDIQSYHGAVTSEKVLSSGLVEQNSNLFRRSNGEIYSGPVHLHEQVGYMVGSEHSTRPHDVLSVEIVDNLKIKDRRNKIYEQKEITEQQLQNPYFSELYTTFDIDGTPSSFFTINLRSLFLNRTEYGSTLLNLDETLFQDMLKKFKIELFTLDRHQISSGFLSNPLNTAKAYASSIYERTNILKTTDSEEFLLRSNIRLQRDSHTIDVPASEYQESKYVDYKQISKIQEVFVDQEYSLRHFEFDDSELTKTSNGQYRYKISLLVRDPTLNYVSGLRTELRDEYSELESYYVRTSLMKYKRTDMHAMNQEFIDTEYETYSDNLSAAPWISTATTYVKFLSFINEIDEQEQQALKSSLFAQLDPRTTNDSYVNSFLQKYLELMTRFDNFFILSGDRLYDSEKLITNTNNFSKDTIEVDHTFENHIQPNLNFSQIDFIGQERQNIGLLKVNKDYYSNLGTQQIHKMVNEVGSLTDAGFEDLNDELKLAFDDVTSHSLSYLSPHAIINQAAVYQTYSNSVVTMKEIKEQTREAKNKSSAVTNLINRDRLNASLKNNINFSILTPRLVLPIQKDDDGQLIKSRDYLNDVSYFVRYDENIELCVSDEANSAKAVEPDIQESLTNPVCRSLTQYDFLEDDNRFSRALRMGSQEGNVEMLKVMPIHIKVLFASKSSKAKNNYAESGMNYLCKSETRNYIEVNHFTINQTEYLSGYGVNSDGETNIKNPIWLLLTAEVLNAAANPLICRSRKYENPTLGLTQACSLNIPTAHEFFIISDMDTRLKMMSGDTSGETSLSQRAQNALNESVLYSTSNIVSQPKNKDSLIAAGEELQQTQGAVLSATPTNVGTAVSTTDTGRVY